MKDRNGRKNTAQIRTFDLMKIKNFRVALAALCVWAFPALLSAQLDTIHWIPPMYGGQVTGEQFIDLTTPEIAPFQVTIRDGAGSLVQLITVSNAQPFRYKLSDTYSQVAIADILLQQVLPSSGLVLSAPKPFQVGFRAFDETTQNACYLTCRGRESLGKTFRIGHIWQRPDKTGERNNFAGVMATENNTEITLSGFDQTAPEFSGSSSITVTLQRGESIVFAHKVGSIINDWPYNALMGALLEASKPVIVNCGSWMGAPVVYEANDIGIAQILPLERVGKQYVFVRGNGPTNLEHPIVVAHYNNTKVFLNDEQTTPEITLQAGEYYVVPAAFYLPSSNIYIRTSEPAFMYQMIGGVATSSSSLKTGSLVFVPPINCGLPKKIDNIYQPNRLKTTRFDGGLMIVAERDSAVIVRLNGAVVPIGDPVPVRGNNDFEVYRAMTLFEHIGTPIETMTVESGGTMQVSMIQRRFDTGYAALFSGPVLRRPVVHLSVTGDGVCPDTLMATGDFDGLQWIYDDSLFHEGPERTFLIAAPRKYKAIAYIGGCRETATTIDSITVPLTAPSFTYTVQEPSCFGYPDGQITMSTPNGGTPPYQYSINFGQQLSDDPFFDTVRGGKHKLIVLDASGCYNEPVLVNLGQPDSVYVNLFVRYAPNPIRPGDEITLEGATTVPITATEWRLPNTTGCANCLTQLYRPENSGWVALTVYDEGNCPGTDSIWIQVEPPVFGPNIINPGADNGNDRFTLHTEHPLPIHQLRIFDRWGELVFEKQNFTTNNPDDGWDGFFRGKRASGVFVFTAEVEVEPGRVITVNGDILVL